MPGKKAGRKRPRDSGERADDEEEAFPRGGADLLTPFEKKQLEKQALQDVEAELHSDGVKASAGKAAGKRHKRAEEDSFVFKTAVVGKEQKYVELLKYKALHVGVKLWGVVQDITISELTVSLPHGLRGFVRPQQASDVLALMLDPNSKLGARLRRAHGGLKPLPTLMDLFRVGQFVRCSICELAGGEDDEQPRGKRRIGLSLLLSDLHDGLEPAALQPGLPLCACVSTVEDHGYTLALGIPGVQSFLSAADVQEHFGAEAHLLPGAMVEGVVTEAKAGGRLVSLSCRPASVSSATLTDGSGLSMQTLLPGFLVTARIRKVLSDGLLVSFLTYFHGTVDVFHLSHSSDPGNLAATFSVDQRLKARIVFVDAASKRVGLSLLSHLVHYHLPDSMPLLGEVHEKAMVVRVDANLGVLLRLPTHPLPSLGYAHVSNVSDERLKSLAKAVKPGQEVAARVIGFRPLDGLATLTLKPSALQQQVVSYKDIVPGSVLSGTVTAVSDAGLMVALSSGMRVHVPAAHALELGNTRPIQSKFREGQPVTGRVLESDAAAKKAVMTLRKALVSSKLPIIAGLQDAQPGTRSHGIVTRILDHGIVVRFYCGIRGLAAKSELGLSGGEDVADQFKLGQVVKAWVLRAVPDKQRLRLSLVGSTGARATGGSDRLGGFSIRDVVQQAVVHRLVAEEEGGEHETAEGGPAAELKEVVLHAEGAGGGSVELHLPAAHLSDHPTAAASLAAILQPGMRLGPLVVVSRTKQLRVSCKASLLAAADSLPADVAEVAEGMVLPGYIASVTADSVFVRFMGELTARAGPAQLADGFLPDAQRHFALGQSVRALVLKVEGEKGRISVSLKPSAAGASAAQLARALLQGQQLAHRLQVEAGVEGVVPPEVWESDLLVGGPCSATVDAVKEYGVTCDLAANEELVGLVPTPHLPPAASVAGKKKRKAAAEGEQTASAAALQPGQGVVACILDVSPVDGIVDLSLLPDLVQAATAGGASRGSNMPALQPGTAQRGAASRKLRAVVQQCKPDYLVVSLPDHQHAIGMLAVAGFNEQQQQVHQQFQVGQQLAGCLACEPCCGRLLLELPAKRAPQPPAQPKARRSKAAGALPAGTVVEATVLRVHPFHVDLEVAAPEPDAPPMKARACITDVADPPTRQAAECRSPLADLTKGAVVAAAVLPQSATGRSHLHGTLELSLRCSVVEAAKAGEPPPAGLQWEQLAAGQRLSGFVQKQEGCYTWLLFSRSIRGRAFVLPGSRGEAAPLKQGRLVECTALSVDAERHLLDVAIGTEADSAAGLKVGQIVAGQMVSSSAHGVTVQLGPGRFGTVALTDLHDTFVDNALHLAKDGTVVQAVVLEEPAEQHKPVALSLRSSRGGSNPCAVNADLSSMPECPEELDVAQLQVGQELHAYVKAVSKSGCFLLLARSLEARVKLRNLADGFVDDPAAEFPPGRHVQGWIVSLQGGMVEVSLKRSRREIPWQQLQGLNEGDIVTGRVRKLERYGAFVDLDNSALSGLVHVSEIADKRLKEPAAALQVGQRVRCRVLSVDLEARKLSLGTKPSYFAGEADEGGDGVTSGWEQDVDDLMADLDGGGDDAGEDVEGDDADLEERMLNAMDAEVGEDREEEEESEGEEQGGLRIGWEEEEEDEEEAGKEEEEDRGGEGLGMDESRVAEHELLSEEPEELGSDEEADSDAGEEEEEEEPGGSDVDQPGLHESDEDQEDDDDGDEEEEEEEEDEDEDEEEETDRIVQTTGRAGTGAGWQQLSLAEEEAAADDGQEGGAAGKKLSKAEKKRLKKEREEAVRRAEAAKIDGIQQPETAQHFEQLLRASPDSSLLWIKYMAHLIGVGEVDQARAVAERALQGIGYREEQEKLNVWIAWLNLESVYGEPEPVEALMALFHRALQYTDQKKLYITMLGILQRINKDEQTQQVLKAMTRKFRASCKIWLANLEWLVKQGRSRDAQATLDRALKSLDKRKHLKVISSMARLEFRLGSAERGRGLLDNVLRNYPKRLDIWNQYLDQELKQGDIPRIRALFDRVTHLLLPARKLKHFFKRYLQFEMEHGDAAAVQRVKDHALEVARSVA